MPTIDPTVNNAVQTLKQLDQKISHYREILSLIKWDMETGAPPKGKSLRSKAKGTLSEELFALSLSTEMSQCLDLLTKEEVQEQLDVITKAQVRERKRHYDKMKSIPPEEYKEYVILTSDAQHIWEKAKQTNDFASFEPTLSKVVDFQKKFIDYYGYEGHPYDALLDNFEPDLTVDEVDSVFSVLRKDTIDLLNRIQNSSYQPNTDLFNRHFDIDKQRDFSLHVLSRLGYDLEAGRMDESAHPFASGLNTGDVRITTRFKERDMRSAIFGTIHECGHALYEQGVNPDYEGTVLRRGTSFGIHESQSRFLENMVGRSAEFWSYFYGDLQSFFPKAFEDVSLDEFTRAINSVEPSLIRVEADELTYNLHIMIRYEIEKALFADDIEVKELPRVWNEKMEEYLGVVPGQDAEGVLQDVHWAFGGFGYFPSYTLGNLYAAQFLNKMVDDMPDFYDKIKSGQFLFIRRWLGEHIHQYGKLYTPSELLEKVTGEPLNAQYLTDYLEQKYSSVYNL